MRRGEVWLQWGGERGELCVVVSLPGWLKPSVNQPDIVMNEYLQKSTPPPPPHPEGSNNCSDMCDRTLIHTLQTIRAKQMFESVLAMGVVAALRSATISLHYIAVFFKRTASSLGIGFVL